MSRKHFSILLVATLVAALAVSVLVPRKTGHEPQAGTRLLLPEVAGRINDVTGVTVRRGEETVTLQRSDELWRIAELGGYPADWGRLRSLLAALAQAEVVEQKTDNPAYYVRLGVEDPAQPGATGVWLELAFDGDRQALIVGKDAGAREGQYVRLAATAGSVLIDRVLEVDSDPVEWAEREVMNVASADVAEVEIIHPDGDWVLARKAAPADTDFTLESLPEGRELASAWSVNSLASALSALRMDQVRPAGEPPPEDTVRFRLLTFGGLEYMVQAWQEDDEHWIQAQAAVPLASGERQPPAAGQEPADAAAIAVEDEARLQAAAFAMRSDGWQFRIPEYKYSNLAKRGESLLKPVDQDPAEQSPASGG